MRNSAGSAGTLGLGLVAQADPAVLPTRGRGPGVAQSPFTDVTSSTLALEDRGVAGQRRKKKQIAYAGVVCSLQLTHTFCKERRVPPTPVEVTSFFFLVSSF